MNLFHALVSEPKAATMGLIKAVFFYRPSKHRSPFDRDAMVGYRNVEMHEDRRGRLQHGTIINDDGDFVPLRTDGPSAAFALPTDHYGSLEDAAFAGDYDYGTDDDECVDPWHGTHWTAASNMFAEMRVRAELPPPARPNSVPNPNENINHHSPEFGERNGNDRRGTDWAGTERRQRAQRDSQQRDADPGGGACGVSHAYPTPPGFDAAMAGDETQVGDGDGLASPVSLDSRDAYGAVIDAAAEGRIPTPRSQMEAVAAAGPIFRGLTERRATAPGRATVMINAIRDGRAARADAAEAREEASARRGTRQRAPKKRFSPQRAAHSACVITDSRVYQNFR
jgi:hypothetical protein